MHWIIGKIGIVGIDECAFNQQINAIVPNNNIKSKYLAYVLFYNRGRLNDIANAPVVPIINKSEFENFEVNIIGDIKKQESIIQILDKIENIIYKYECVLNHLDTLIKDRFVEMFGDPISNSMGWDISTLKEITDVRDGTHDSPEYVIEGYPFITSKNISDDRIDFSEVQYISYEDYHKFEERSHVDDGDILMPMIGTIGGAVMVKKDRDFSIKNVALIKFNEKSDVNNVFIKALLNSYEMKKYFNILKTGGTQKFIGLGIIRDLPIITPSIEIQNEYKTFVQHIDKLKFDEIYHII